ncbi:hypothetical protein FFLO_06160 [Filobasidium floriforme]|uniref:Vacuolar protein sorting-associated protein 35 n=1 Tax=Filobasidium floriforme TaxID=5210 RepID=A0A8K0JFX9_9TREE|nr:hypothetical protein FFLO_06160 [Filobasidium floriforme]
MDDARILQDALGVVKMQSVAMKRSLDTDQIMEALKSASTMLAELRTSSLSPKQYYELYMSVFDALRHLTTYLYDAHTSGKHHLADLYELVQYAGKSRPRLYLMITVGSIYMSIPDAPVKEIMKDMLEMTRGVQHATRGLFLRHYLSGQTRDYLPVGESSGADGNLQDSIAFVLTNFVEMNKLWVRLQHQGHSKEREKREMERKELRILVGTNLVRLSQLEGVDLTMYRQAILPSILEQVVGCRDIIAQEYLMEVVIQVFTDEFHLHTLTPFLSATAQLHPKVNVKQIVISLIDRLAGFAAREAENETPEEKKAQEEELARRLADRVKSTREGKDLGDSMAGLSVGKEKTSDNSALRADNEGKSLEPVSPEQDATDSKALDSSPSSSHLKFRGIPRDVRLFEIFWQQVVQLISVRPDLSVQDVTALLVSLLNLALSCYPDRLEYVDYVLQFAQRKMEEYVTHPELLAIQTTTNLLSLLLAPVTTYTSALTLLAIPSYQGLLAKQQSSTRTSIGQAIVASILKSNTRIERVEDVNGVLTLCRDLVTDDGESHRSQSNSTYIRANRESTSPSLAEEQGWLARIVHLFSSADANKHILLLRTARDHFILGGQRIQYTFPALVSASLRLARTAKDAEVPGELLRNVLKFTHQLVFGLYTQVETSETSLRLFLAAAQMADECRVEDLAYEFFVQAFTIYEESISESNAQLDTITAIMSALQTSRVFGTENYDTLITKAALHGSKLLKKPHQAAAVLQASHMWWQTDIPGQTTTSSAAFRDDKRVLECLQKALRIASSCVDEASSVRLYVQALDKYIYYFEQALEAVTPKYINSLTELITSNIDFATPTRTANATRLIDLARGDWDTIQVQHMLPIAISLCCPSDVDH